MGGGTPPQKVDTDTGERSIPAWAGEPEQILTDAVGPPVYPRVGGGTGLYIATVVRCSGLSPRGRGNRGVAMTEKPDSGSIPAWAGEPWTLRNWQPGQRVYPRVGGGTSSNAALKSMVLGLSPRGRGNLPFSDDSHRLFRSIPAWAGEPETPTLT